MPTVRNNPRRGFGVAQFPIVIGGSCIELRFFSTDRSEADAENKKREHLLSHGGD